MKCSKCGREIDETMERCSCSAEESSVRVLSREEKDSYAGTTIDVNETTGQDDRRGGYHQYGQGGSRIYVRHFDVGGMSWLTRALIVLGGIALMIFALPIALAFFSFLLILWLIGRILH